MPRKKVNPENPSAVDSQTETLEAKSGLKGGQRRGKATGSNQKPASRKTGKRATTAKNAAVSTAAAIPADADVVQDAPLAEEATTPLVDQAVAAGSNTAKSRKKRAQPSPAPEGSTTRNQEPDTMFLPGTPEPPVTAEMATTSGAGENPFPSCVSLQEQIALLAYFYWQARGCHGGSPEEDWYRAEREIHSRIRNHVGGD